MKHETDRGFFFSPASKKQKMYPSFKWFWSAPNEVMIIIMKSLFGFREKINDYTKKQKKNLKPKVRSKFISYLSSLFIFFF